MRRPVSAVPALVIKASSVGWRVCAVWLGLTAGFWGQQAQVAGPSREIPDAPSSAMRMSLAIEPAVKRPPKPNPWRLLDGETDHLSNREVFDKKFWAVHGMFLDSIIYDAELTHQGLAHHRCVEGNINLGQHPSRGEIYRNNLLEQFVPLTFMDWALGKYVWKGLGYEGATMGSVIHFRGGTKWLTSGCW